MPLPVLSVDLKGNRSRRSLKCEQWSKPVKAMVGLDTICYISLEY